jgi:hypothetical protein
MVFSKVKWNWYLSRNGTSQMAKLIARFQAVSSGFNLRAYGIRQPSADGGP